jgi:hypothetical protein
MKDIAHHLKHLQRKVIQSERKASRTVKQPILDLSEENPTKHKFTLNALIKK